MKSQILEENKKMHPVCEEFVKTIKYLYKKHSLDDKELIKMSPETIVKCGKFFIANFTKQVTEFDAEDQELMKIFGWFV